MHPLNDDKYLNTRIIAFTYKMHIYIVQGDRVLHFNDSNELVVIEDESLLLELDKALKEGKEVRYILAPKH